MWVKKATIAAAFAVAVVGSVPGIAHADPTTPAPGPPPGPPTALVTSIGADGTYAVGTDLAPGVYTTAGPVGDGTCFWKRLGADGSTIDNALTKKPQTVQIDATDKSFKTNGCQPWTVSDAPPPPQAAGLGPIVAGLQLQAYMAQLNANAAASGQTSGQAPVPPPP